MEEEKRLYPLCFEPIEAEHPWGKESYLLADLGVVDSEASTGWLKGDSLSDIMETYIDRMVGDNVYYYFGRQFPVAVRRLSVTGRTPVWVCPDDKIAGERYDALGKEKLWHVVSAAPDARLYLGLDHDMTATEFYRACMEGTLGTDLHAVTPKAGEWYWIAPGVLHAAQGVELVEISEASLLDIKVFDWGAFLDSEDLGAVDAIDFVRLQAHVPSAPAAHRHEDPLADVLADGDVLTVTRIRLEQAMHIDGERFDGFLAYTRVAGAATLSVGGDPVTYVIGKGETLLVPAESPDLVLVPQDRATVLLETTAHGGAEPDSYINTDAEPYLEGEDYSKDEDLDDRIDWSLAHPDV